MTSDFVSFLRKLREATITNHEDLVIIIDGKERSGKSALARWLAYQIDEGFNIDKVYFSIADLKRLLRNVREGYPGQVHVLDEGQNFFHKRLSRTKVNTAFDMFFKSIGSYQQIFMICTPTFWDLDAAILRRADILIHVVDRGEAIAYRGKTLRKLVLQTLDLLRRGHKIFTFAELIDELNIPFQDHFLFEVPNDETEYWKRKKQHLDNFLKYLEDLLPDYESEPGAEGERDNKGKNMRERLLSTTEFSELVGVSRKTVYNWMKRGWIRVVRLPNGKWRIPESELKKVMQA